MSSVLEERIAELKRKLEVKDREFIRMYYECATNLEYAKSFKASEDRLIEERNSLKEQLSEIQKDPHRLSYEREKNKKNVELIKINSELKQKIIDIEQRSVFDPDKTEFSQKISDLKRVLEIEKNMSEKERKTFADDKMRLVKEKEDVESKLHACKLLNVKLSEQISDFEKVLIVERSKMESEKMKECLECLELKKKISVLQAKLEDERKKFAREKQTEAKKYAALVKTTSEKKKWLEISLENEKSSFDSERQVLEDKVAVLSNTISELQKKEMLDQTDFEKDLHVEKEKYEEKVAQLSNMVSELQKNKQTDKAELQKDSNSENKKITERVAEKEKFFEKEKQELQKLIDDLKRQLFGLKTDIWKEGMEKSDLKRKFDLIVEERNVLSARVKEIQLNTVNASSPVHSKSSSTKSCTSNAFSSGQIHKTKFFHNHSVFRSNNYSMKIKKVWKKKSATDEGSESESSVVDSNSFVPKTDKPMITYSISKLISLNKKKISSSGTNESAKKKVDWYGTYCIPYVSVTSVNQNRWYGTYSIPSVFNDKSNSSGPNWIWVPKSC